MEVLKIAGLAFCIICAVVIYACFMAASTSDEQAEKMFKEYLEWKEKHETDKRRRRGRAEASAGRTARMTQYVRRSSEDSEQETVIQWARMMSGRWPELALLHHIPNGGSRNKKEAVKLKRMGVLAGVADLHLPVSRSGYHGLYIEMKFEDGRLLKSQKDFLKAAAAERYYCVVCYSAADAIEILDKYMHNRSIENLSIVKGGKIIGLVK